jgi:DNA-binding CsgD family transcriptional regulator
VPLVGGLRAFLAGRLPEAESCAEEALALGQRLNNENARLLAMVQLWLVRREQARAGELEAEAAAIVRQFPSIIGWRILLALIRADAGRIAEARDGLDAIAADGYADVPGDYLWLGNMALLVDLCLCVGDDHQAAGLYDLLRPYEHVCIAANVIICWGSAARLLGLLAAKLGRSEAACRHFETALAANVRMGLVPWIAHTQFGYAVTLSQIPATDRSGEHRERATLLCDQALATATASGMAWLAADAQALRDKLTRLSARVGAAPSDRLTARETEVLRLLASGRTTHEIAADLVLSAFTVERHITNIYRKIGARGRADATAYAFSHRLVSTPDSL